jgi:hypothetical protein
MIQPLRTVHRGAFIALAFVLPAVLVAGLGARRPRVPSRVQGIELPGSAYLVKTSDALWQRHSIEMNFYRASNSPGEILVALRPRQALNNPDLLLYWSIDQPTDASLPSSSQLLGSLTATKVFTLPLNTGGGGYLVLFSLPHQNLFDYARVGKLP